MRRTKILFVIDHVGHIGGGTEGQLSKLVNGLDRNEFEVHLAVLRHSSWIETGYFDCPKFVVGITSFRNPGAWLKIRRLVAFIRNEKFDIVQTYFPDSNLAGVMAARWGRARKIVSTQRNLGHDLNRSRILALKVVSTRVDRYLVNCQAVRESLILKLGVPRDKVGVIYNGIEYQKFGRVTDKSPNELKQELGVRDGELTVGLVSNLRPIKNIEGFLCAAAQVAGDVPQARFLIVGDGEAAETRRLRRLSDDLGIGRKVTWTGVVEDVTPYLDVLDLGVLSSRSEGLSNTILEYMASGLPVVAASVGGTPELVVEGEGGFLVPPDDSAALAEKITLLLNDAGLRNAMGKTNQRIVREKFSLTQMIDRHRECFRQLLDH
ncbi:MAG: glycosyltransferase [Candidatus Eisenbacteria bacterium]|nr:glycosyltransferase [Candidatus Eisenbacteria bacterium]